MGNDKKFERIRSKNDRVRLTDDRPAVILLDIKCNLDVIRVVHVSKLYCTVLFVWVLLTSVSNTYKLARHTLMYNSKHCSTTKGVNVTIPSLENMCD